MFCFVNDLYYVCVISILALALPCITTSISPDPIVVPKQVVPTQSPLVKEAIDEKWKKLNKATSLIKLVLSFDLN